MEPVENMSDDQLLVIIRQATNTNVPGSQYQKAKAEWDIRHQKAMLEATKSNRPAFISVAPGGKIDGLRMERNTMIGNADFIRNEGELKNADLKDNKHIISLPPKKTGFIKSAVGQVITGLVILIIGYLIFSWLGWKW